MQLLKPNESLKTAKLLQQGQHQLIELPDSFHFNGSEVFVKQIDNGIIFISTENPWKSLFNSLDKFSDDFMEPREQPNQQAREDVFT